MRTEEEKTAPAGPYKLSFLKKMGAEVKQNSGFLLRRAMEGEERFTQLSKDFSQKTNLLLQRWTAEHQQPFQNTKP